MFKKLYEWWDRPRRPWLYWPEAYNYFGTLPETVSWEWAQQFHIQYKPPKAATVVTEHDPWEIEDNFYPSVIVHSHPDGKRHHINWM